MSCTKSCFLPRTCLVSGTLRSLELLPRNCLGKRPGTHLHQKDCTFILSPFSPLCLHSLLCWFCISAIQMSVSEGTLFANSNNHSHSSNSDIHVLLILFLSLATPHVWNIVATYFTSKINIISYGVNGFLLKNMPYLGAF